MNRNDIYQAVVSELDLRGIRHNIENGGKHYKVVFVANGRTWKWPITRSRFVDRRAVLNARSDIRRIIEGVQP